MRLKIAAGFAAGLSLGVLLAAGVLHRWNTHVAGDGTVIYRLDRLTGRVWIGSFQTGWLLIPEMRDTRK